MKYALVTCFVVSAILAPVQAADSSYLGVWKLSSAVVAPWADPKQKPDSAEQSRLLGKTGTFKAKEITGDIDPVRCCCGIRGSTDIGPL